MPIPTPKTSLAPVESMLMDAVTSQAFIDAVRMNLFDHLSENPMRADTLAQIMGFKPEPLEALLDVLAHRKLLEADGKTYVNTHMTNEYLVSSSPLYQGKALELQCRYNDVLRQGISTLLKGGEMQREKTDERWAESEMMDGTLQHALNGQIQLAAEYLTSIPEFPSFRTMADIGGNHGHYSMELLAHNPELTSTIYDLPHVVEPAQKRCNDLGFGDRIACQALDLREDKLPETAYDFVFTSHMLYACRGTLDDVSKNIHQSLRPGGCFASHHLAPEGGASEHYKRNVELITRLVGYETHFLSRDELEKALSKAGFGDFTHTFTGTDRQTLLLVARKK